MTPVDDAYTRLAHAIVVLAGGDYDASRRRRHTSVPGA